MKTAISIPDTVYETAEKLAERLGTSRSKLYTQALRTYLAVHQADGVTQKLNEVYGDSTITLDPVLKALQTRSLPKETW